MGPTAVVFSQKDPVALAKALTDFAKDIPACSSRPAWWRGAPSRRTQIRDIASLPSREELIAKLLFLMQSPDHPLRTGAGRRAAVVRHGPGPGPEEEGRSRRRPSGAFE